MAKLRPLDCDFGEFLDEREFLRLRRQLPPGQLIRVYNRGRASSAEDYYVVGKDGRLFNARTGERAEPDVLSRERAPDHWCFEGADPGSLPDEEIRVLIEAGEF